MSEKMIPLSAKRHAKLRLMPLKLYSHAAATHMAMLLPNEFPLACSIYPIVFVQQKEQFHAVALLGVTKSQNLFIAPDGRWLAPYIPAAIRRYPFSLARRENSEELILCFDESSGLFSENEGKPLFHEDGSPAEVMQQTHQFLGEFVRLAQQGERLFNHETFTSLLIPMQIQLSDGEKKTTAMAGVFHIDEKKLKALPDETFLEMRKKGSIPLIYAHLLSLRRVNALAERLRVRSSAVSRPAVPGKTPQAKESGGLPDSFHFE